MLTLVRFFLPFFTVNALNCSESYIWCCKLFKATYMLYTFKLFIDA